MSVILLMLGIVVAAAGVATIGFGIPFNEFTLGTTLIISGTTALTGGLILIGLSAVVTELGRVAEGLRTRVAARPAARAAETQECVAAQPLAPAAPAIAAPAPAMAPVSAAAIQPPLPQRARPEAPAREVRPPEPYPVGPSAVEVSAAAIERLRSSIPRTERPRADQSAVADLEEVPLSPNGAHHPAPQRRPQSVEEPAPEPKVSAEVRAGGAAVEASKASRLDFLFRSKPARPAPPQPQPENFDSFWPADARQERNAPAEPQAQPRFDQIERQTEHAAPVQERRAEPAPADEPHTAAILKSGVVDGMAYTLYADGSIEAKLPHGTVRFGSIAELRAHIESNS